MNSSSQVSESTTNFDIKNVSNDNARITYCLGLIAAYIAIMTIFANPTSESLVFLNSIKLIIAVAWGIPTLFLTIYLLLYGLSLKFTDPDKLEILEFQIVISSRLKRAFFDTGVEWYIKGFFIYGLYSIPSFLINKGFNIYLSLIVLFIVLILLSYVSLLINRKKNKSGLKRKVI